jgi:hypothetical protein
MGSDLSGEVAQQTSPQTRPGYKWSVVFIVWLICFFNFAD